MSEAKVLVFDIETAPLVAHVWGRRDVNISLNQIKSDTHVIAWAAKWFKAPASEVMYQDQRDAKRIGDDRVLVRGLWKLLDEADIVITQNGKSFDSKILNARFIMHGMKPPSPYKHLDTLIIARGVAKFTSNKLEYLTDKLCTKYKKLSHAKFPGMSLWNECLAGNRKAWDEMRRYNIHDVLSTEELYMKLRAWAPESSPSVHLPLNPLVSCRCCGEAGQMIKKGTQLNRKGRHRMYQCKACGTFQKGENIKTVGVK